MPYYTPEQIDEAKKMDLLTYLKNYDPSELVKETAIQYCTKEHDSLKISNGFWNWCSRGIGGRNAVDYLTKVKKYKFIDAVDIIMKKQSVQAPIYTPKEEKRAVQNLILPPKNDNENRIKQYLNSRGIDKEIIQKCIDKKLIYEEKNYHNVVFVGYDEMGNAKYAGCRSTGEKTFKNDATGSNKKYSFRLESEQKTDTIYMFEGAIDALSFASFFKLYGQSWKDKTYISLAGVYQPAKIIEQSKVPLAIQNYLDKHSEVKEIVLCLDNDEAGRKATKALQIVLSDKYKVRDKPPKFCKDYNEYLCKILGIRGQENDKKLTRNGLEKV